MSDPVTVEMTQENAVLLLAAAAELGLPSSVVKTSDGALTAPQEVHDKAFRAPDPEPEEKPPVKRTAKRSAKKK